MEEANPSMATKYRRPSFLGTPGRMTQTGMYEHRTRASVIRPTALWRPSVWPPPSEQGRVGLGEEAGGWPPRRCLASPQMPSNMFIWTLF